MQYIELKKLYYYFIQAIVDVLHSFINRDYNVIFKIISG